MIPFQVAEALRRVRRARRVPSSRAHASPSLGRLVAGEAAYLAGTLVRTPAVPVAVAGVVTSAGVYVALGPGYPGPVAPSIARWVLVVVIVLASIGLARATPRRWRDIRYAVGRARLGLAVLLTAAAISILKVGLHDVTPGPALPAPARWTAVAAVLVCAVALTRGHDRAS